MSTSPTCGALRITLGPSPSIAATMCLVTAFLEPRTEMSPRSGPDGSTVHVCVTPFTLCATRPASSQNATQLSASYENGLCHRTDGGCALAETATAPGGQTPMGCQTVLTSVKARRRDRSGAAAQSVARGTWTRLTVSAA